MKHYDLINLKEQRRCDERFYYIDGFDDPIRVREWDGQRVLPFSVVDCIHCKNEGTTRKAFYRLQKRLTRDEDYYLFRGLEDRNRLIKNGYSKPEDLPNSNNFSFVLLTMSGYLMITKTFQDDLAWKVYKQMIGYFTYVNKIKNLYDALRAIADKLQQQEYLLNSTVVVQEEQQHNIKEIEYKMETPIAKGALTPSELAEKLNIYSLNKLPHAAIIEDICLVLKIKAKSRVIPPEDDYSQFRVETKGNVQIIQCYLKPLAQKMIEEWWNTHKELIKTIEFYKINKNGHLKGEPKRSYYKIWNFKRYILD